MTTKIETGWSIIFKAEPNSKYGWSQREDGIGGLTNILAEHSYYDPDSKVPEPGYRLSQFQPNSLENEQGGLSRRDGDWVVTKVERYQAISSECDCSEVIICYCKYNPVPEQWERVPTLEELASSAENKLEFSVTNQE